MKQLFSILASVLLLAMGSVNAMADDWSIDFRNLVNADKTPVVISTTETVTIGGTTLGTISYGNTSVDSKFVLQTGTSWLLYITGGLYQFNGGNRAFGLQDCTAGQIITITASGDPSVATNATLKSSGGGTWVYTVNDDGGVKFNPARYLYFYTISVEDPSLNNVSYTVKYVDQDGNSIKDDVTYQDEPGTPITLSDQDKANIYYDGMTFIYVSDDAEGQTVAADGSTIVTVVFRVAETFSYTVNEVCDGITLRTTTGQDVESTVVKVPYHQYNLIDDVLYGRGAVNKEYNYTFTLNQDSQVENLTYSSTDITNVVYFSEAEDMEGAIANNGGNANIRCSNSYGAYFSDDVTITSLPAGTYKVSAQVWGNSGVTFNIKAGEDVVLEAATVGYINLYTSEEFTLTETTDIIIPAAGSNGKVVDYVYIQEIPAIYHYSVVTNLGNTINSGSVSAGESVTISYPEYILMGDELFRTSLRNATGDGYYLYTFTPEVDGDELVIEYSSDIQNVAYFSEAEDIIGAEVNDRGNANIRCSNGLGALFPEDITITTLPPGVYKIGTQVWGNAGVTFTFQAGDYVALEANTVGYLNTYTSEVFTLENETDINVLAAGSNGKLIDWIYIVKIADFTPMTVNITSAGYATFYDSMISYEVPENVTAYIVEDVSNKILSMVEITDCIPAGTGVILEGEEGEYNLNAINGSFEPVLTNYLQGSDTETVFDDPGYKYYILSFVNDNPETVGFYFQEQNGESVTNGAHKAFLALEREMSGDANSFLFNQTDGITEVNVMEQKENIAYSLSGVRVDAAHMQKGIYVVNGKKIIVK